MHSQFRRRKVFRPWFAELVDRGPLNDVGLDALTFLGWLLRDGHRSPEVRRLAINNRTPAPLGRLKIFCNVAMVVPRRPADTLTDLVEHFIDQAGPEIGSSFNS